jgi:hypothetical protein
MVGCLSVVTGIFRGSDLATPHVVKRRVEA